MTARPQLLRAVAVSTATVGFAFCSAGMAHAATAPLPPIPSPDDLVTTVQQTVQTVTTTVQKVTGSDPTTLIPGSAAPKAPKHAAAAHPRAAAHTARPAAATSTHTTAPAGFAMPSLDLADLHLPAVNAAAPRALTPAIAPASATTDSTPTTRIVPAAVELAHGGTSTMRLILLALATWAAAALSFEHLRQLRRTWAV